MPERHLATYLNDHLAGSVAVLELLEHFEKEFAGTSEGRFLAEIRADITTDRRDLEGLMARLEVPQSGPRKAAAWLAEKFNRVKLGMDDTAGGPLRLLEVLEAVAVGLHGQCGMWAALEAASEDAPALRGTDYRALEKRAQEQRSRVEVERLKAARAALADADPTGGSAVAKN
jgi:hypothetical protein